MRCTICKKTSDEIHLFNGIMEADMVMICEDCAEDQKVPIIRKPSVYQLDKANERYSVRERMERMSGMRDRTESNHDQLITQGNLAKLRMPPKKQKHEDVMDNYYWTLGMARKRKKLTLNHLATKMGTTSEVIRKIERGILPENFKEIFLKLEAYLGIELLRNQPNKVNFTRINRDAEKDILESVKSKMEGEDEVLPEEGEDDLLIPKKKDSFRITINDLINRKKRKEAQALKKKAKEDDDAMIGDDLDLEISEL